MADAGVALPAALKDTEAAAARAAVGIGNDDEGFVAAVPIEVLPGNVGARGRRVERRLFRNWLDVPLQPGEKVRVACRRSGRRGCDWRRRDDPCKDSAEQV
jgi:hypothetical protein